MKELKSQTIALRNHLIQLKERFINTPPPKDRRNRDFFAKVKEETEPIYQLLDEWEDKALLKVKNREVSIHPHQVASTKENMELILMHSYFIDAREKRYMELYQSVIYIFDQLLRDLE